MKKNIINSLIPTFSMANEWFGNKMDMNESFTNCNFVANHVRNYRITKSKFIKICEENGFENLKKWADAIISMAR